MASFAAQIKDFADKTEKRMDQAVRKISLDLYNKIVLKTPVDTGRARANWDVGLNRMPASVTAKTRWRSVKQAAQALIQKIVAGDKIYIINNLDYIVYLEEGKPGPGSDQAPNGMVALTLREYPGIVRQATNDAKRRHP